MSTPYVGEIRIFAGTFAPQGWAFCDGSTIAIAQNETLFNLIGTTYGGDGQNTFNLPDLRSRLPIHQGQGTGLSNYVIGQNGGVESVTLTTSQIANHAHPLLCNSGGGTQRSPAGGVPAADGTAATTLFTDDTAHLALMGGGLGSIGGSQPHDNMMPYQVVNYIISLYGVFPTQN